MLLDQIKIENLEVFAHHGVFPEETKNGQNFYVNMDLYTNTRAAGIEDDLTLSTHYGEVCQFVNQFMKEHTYLLIESVAEQLAEGILLLFPRIHCLDLEIRKPNAPIPLPFESVSVKIQRGWKRAYIAFGSSMGKREQYITEALEAIKGNQRIRLQRVSQFIRTAPYGGVAKEEFINGALSIDTLLTPNELLFFLQQVEKAGGRTRELHWGDRTLDLDILLYEGEVVDDQTLTIPHKDMANRDFVLVPLAQIAPYEEHPVLHKSIWELKAHLEEHKK